MIKVKTKIIAVILLTVVVIALWGVFAARPLLERMVEDSKKLTWQRSILALTERQLMDVYLFQKKYVQLKGTLDKVDSSFINFKAPIDFIEFLEREAKKSNLEIIIMPSGTGEQDPFRIIDFEIVLAGSFPQCLRFTESLEMSPFLFELSDLRIEKISQRSNWLRRFEKLSIGEVVFNIKLTVFSNHGEKRD